MGIGSAHLRSCRPSQQTLNSDGRRGTPHGAGRAGRMNAGRARPVWLGRQPDHGSGHGRCQHGTHDLTPLAGLAGLTQDAKAFGIGAAVGLVGRDGRTGGGMVGGTVRRAGNAAMHHGRHPGARRRIRQRQLRLCGRTLQQKRDCQECSKQAAHGGRILGGRPMRRPRAGQRPASQDGFARPQERMAAHRFKVDSKLLMTDVR